MKYGELNLGQIEAIVNKLGGMEGVKRFLSGAVTIQEAGNFFSRDMRKEGWELIEDTREPAHVSVADLELVSFLKKGEDAIGGEEMAHRARKDFRANLGQRHAEYLLEHQKNIPEEFRKYYLVFPGTIWRDRDGYRIVPYLRWSGKRWYLGFYWLESDWHASDQLVRPRNSLHSPALSGGSFFCKLAIPSAEHPSYFLKRFRKRDVLFVVYRFDFLGWVHFPNHRVLRTATKRRMMKRVERNGSAETLNSYLSLLRHGNAFKIRERLLRCC